MLDKEIDMFRRIDNENFGEYLTRLRTTHNMTKLALANKAGMTDETIRRIENGQNTPSFNTLNSLSRVMKVDLVKVYVAMIGDNSLNEFYKKLDGLIINNDVDKLKSIAHEFSFYEKKIYNSNVDEIKEVNQFKCILSGLELSFNADNGSKEASECYIEAINITIPNFTVLTIMDFEYSFLELKCVLLLALEENALDNYMESNRLSLELLEYIDQSRIFSYADNLVSFKTKLLVNIAYNYHGLDNDKLAYRYSDRGIEYCIDNHSLYLLYALFYRRAVACYYLKIEEQQMIKDFSNAIAILDTYQMETLKECYIRTTKEKYNISI